MTEQNIFNQGFYPNMQQPMYNQPQVEYMSITTRGKQKQNTSKEEEKDLMSIKLEETEDFNSNVNGSLIVLLDLCKKINQILKPALAGYKGCDIIRTNNLSDLSVTLYFADIDEKNKVKCITNILEGSNGDGAYSKIEKFNSLRKHNKYNLTKEAKEILSEFRPGKRNTKDKFNTAEVVDRSYGQGIIYLAVKDLSLKNFIKKLYGTKNKKGNKVEYEIICTNAFVQNPIRNIEVSNISKYSIILINQFDEKVNKEIYDKVGITNNNAYGFPIVRA